MSNWELELTQEELEEIRGVAYARQNTNRGASNRDGAAIDSFTADELGAVGEKCLSKITRKVWDGKHFSYEDWKKWRLEGGDVEGLEGKCTKWATGRLWLRSGEKQVWHPDRPYVLFRAHNLPRVLAAGWAYGKEIHLPDYLEDGKYGKPCYWMPNEKLRSMESLIELIEAELC